MRSIRSLAALAGAAVLFAQAVPAQSAGTIDLGVFARLNWLDASYSTSTGGGGGAQAGFFFMKNLELEADISTSSNNAEVSGFPGLTYVPVHVRLQYFIPIKDSWSFLVGAGYTHEKFSAQDTSADDSGWGFTLGFRTTIDDRLYASLRYTGDYSSSPANKGSGYDNSYNQGLELGFGFLLGGKKKEAPIPPPTMEPVPAAAPAAAAAVAVAAPPPPPPDDDNDGVINTADKCPATPAGQPVDANGCSASQRDTDGDGVTDDKDKCEGTPAGTKVDAAGCRVEPLVLEGVNFESNKAVLLAGSTVTLDRVASSLVANPTVKIEIDGYTDNTGDPKYNQQLSQSRADAVMAYLVSKGVAADRITAKGFGEENPRASNSTAAGKQENRRVELKVVGE